MTTEHTPGPWQAYGLAVYSADKWTAGVNDGGKWVAQVTPDWPGNEELMPSQAQANAHLIAAAPDLLMTCHEAVESLTCIVNPRKPDAACDCYCCESARFIRAAIAKATGKGAA